MFYQPNYTNVAATCNTWRNHGDSDDKWVNIAKIIQFYNLDEGNFSGQAGPGTCRKDLLCHLYLIIGIE